jgi:beta-lactamase superfamily II metal-dependent hydrolase
VTEEAARTTGSVRLTALAAACGDCLVVEYETEAALHRILIDGGLGSKYEVGLAPHLAATVGDPVQFDVVIVTHVDRDHIDGVVRALREQHLDATDIWFNGRDEIDALVNGLTRGVRQGDELSALIPAERRNRVVEGRAIHVPSTGPVRFELPGDAVCTLLSPSAERLERLLAKWPDPVRVVDDPTEDLLTALDDPVTRGIGEFGQDSSVANGSSIAFLFEVGGASLLLTGDAFASDLETTIGQLIAQRGVPKLHVDLFKLSHHGSRQNMTDGLLDLIDPGAVLVCTDGSKFHHPDEDALQKIRSHYPETPIHFTDATDHIRQRAAAVGAVPPAELPLRLEFGGAPSAGRTIDRAEAPTIRPDTPAGRRAGPIGPGPTVRTRGS